jgi:hypothetical protein
MFIAQSLPAADLNTAYIHTPDPALISILEDAEEKIRRIKELYKQSRDIDT